MDVPRYPYEIPHARHHSRDEIDERAQWIARQEGRMEITQLDRIRAERELRLAPTES